MLIIYIISTQTRRNKKTGRDTYICKHLSIESAKSLLKVWRNYKRQNASHTSNTGTDEKGQLSDARTIKYS